jgi:hypothetical protein
MDPTRRVVHNWQRVVFGLRVIWMSWSPRNRLPHVVIALGLCLGTARSDSEVPPSQLFSPDKTFRVEIITTALPNSDPYEEFYTIVLSRQGNVISKFPTEGYLLNALWSPNGKYVAVNNRRGSSGDYLWVFRLADGKAVKLPDDDAAEAIVRQVSTKFPQFSIDSFNRRYTLARRWNSRSDLEVRTELQFFNLNNAVIRVDELDRVEGDRLVAVSQTIKEVPQRASK